MATLEIDYGVCDGKSAVSGPMPTMAGDSLASEAIEVTATSAVSEFDTSTYPEGRLFVRLRAVDGDVAIKIGTAPEAVGSDYKLADGEKEWLSMRPGQSIAAILHGGGGASES